jgi:hypothetical protein
MRRFACLRCLATACFSDQYSCLVLVDHGDELFLSLPYGQPCDVNEKRMSGKKCLEPRVQPGERDRYDLISSGSL